MLLSRLFVAWGQDENQLEGDDELTSSVLGARWRDCRALHGSHVPQSQSIFEGKKSSAGHLVAEGRSQTSLYVKL